MAKVEIAISTISKTGSLQRQEGDIISVAEYPHYWGYKELKDRLILIIDFPGVEFKQIRSILTRVKRQTPGDETTPIVAKRSYSIPLANLRTNFLPEINLTKVQNTDLVYQPCKSAAQIIEKFDGYGLKETLTINDVDCEMTGVGASEECPISFANNLIFDKIADGYISKI